MVKSRMGEVFEIESFPNDDISGSVVRYASVNYEYLIRLII